MRLPLLISAFLVTLTHAHDDDNHQDSTITSSAFLACATGDAKTKYESCSSSISSKIDECNDSDLKCACSLANEGFSCLKSYCPTRTNDVCAASVLLKGVCAIGNLPGPTLTDLSCPSSIADFLATLLPSDFASFIPTGVIPSNVIPSGINNGMPSNIPFFNGPNDASKAVESGTATGGSVSSTVQSMSAPSQTGAANGRKGEDGVTWFLGLGAGVAVGVAALAAYL